MMYASKIKVDRNPKTIVKSIEKSLGYTGDLTINKLRELGIADDQIFHVYEEDSGEFSLCYNVRRLETKKEVAARVAREISYNKSYDEFHAKYGR